MSGVKVIIESQGGNSFSQGKEIMDERIKEKTKSLEFKVSFYPTVDVSTPGTKAYLMSSYLAIFTSKQRARKFTEDLLEDIREALKASVSCRGDFEIYKPYVR